MPKRLKITRGKCIGCKSCELACSLVNDGELNPERSRITTLIFREQNGVLPTNLPFTCQQCADAPCLKSCPVKAIVRAADEMKTVFINYETCTRCGQCIEACPFGAMLFDAEKNRPFKCELCGGDPACARFCPSGAIEFMDRRPFYGHGPALALSGYRILSERHKKNFRLSRARK